MAFRAREHPQHQRSGATATTLTAARADQRRLPVSLRTAWGTTRRAGHDESRPAVEQLTARAASRKSPRPFPVHRHAGHQQPAPLLPPPITMNNKLIIRQTKDQRTEGGAATGTRLLSGLAGARVLIRIRGLGADIRQVSVLDSSFKVGPGANGAVDALVVQATSTSWSEANSLPSAAVPIPSGRLNSDGSVDSRSTRQANGWSVSAAQQPDRKVLVSGSFHQLLGQSRQRIARLLEDGSVDCYFRCGGLFNTNDSMFSLALQGDGRVLVGYTAWMKEGCREWCGSIPTARRPRLSAQTSAPAISSPCCPCGWQRALRWKPSHVPIRHRSILFRLKRMAIR